MVGAAGSPEVTPGEMAHQIAERMIGLFTRGADGTPPHLRRHGEVPARPALARLPALQRVLPRRQRRRAGREPSNRMDGTGREPDRRMAAMMVDVEVDRRWALGSWGWALACASRCASLPRSRQRRSACLKLRARGSRFPFAATMGGRLRARWSTRAQVRQRPPRPPTSGRRHCAHRRSGRGRLRRPGHGRRI